MPLKVRPKIRQDFIKILALNKESSFTNLYTSGKRDKTTARNALNSLLDDNLVYMNREERVKSRGRLSKIYRLTFLGVITYLYQTNYEHIDIVADNHKDFLRTFSCWSFFQEQKVRDAVFHRLKNVVESKIIQSNSENVAFHLPNKDTFDAEIILSENIKYPLKSLPERISQEEFKILAKIWIAINDNYILSEFRDLIMYQEKVRLQRELQSYEEWSQEYAKKHSGSAELVSSVYVRHRDPTR